MKKKVRKIKEKKTEDKKETKLMRKRKKLGINKEEEEKGLK